jgi:hypothetical protein
MPIKITTVAVDCAAKATSVDNFLAEVVPVITQNFLKRLFCQIPCEAGTAIDEEIRNYKVEVPKLSTNSISSLRPKNKWITTF